MKTRVRTVGTGVQQGTVTPAYTVDEEDGNTFTHYEASAFPTTPDGYVAVPVIADFQQVGRYSLHRGYRRHVNDPGLLRDDFVGHLSSNWNAPPYQWWGRYQGKINVNIGGATYAPLPSYDAQIVNTTPPPANRAAYTAAVQRFISSLGARANG